MQDKTEDYMSRSQLNRGLGRFAALGTAVEERERVLALEEALQQKTDEFEQRNTLLIRSKDALEELGKRCTEAQNVAEQRAAELEAVGSALEEAQSELDTAKQNHKDEIQSMTVRCATLESEVLQLKCTERKHKQAARDAKESKEEAGALRAKLKKLMFDKDECEARLLKECAKLQSDNDLLREQGMEMKQTVESLMEKHTSCLEKMKVLETVKAEPVLPVSKPAKEIPKKFVEAVGLAEQLNDPSRPVQTGQKIFQNQLESLKQLLNQEQQDTLHLKEQIAVERQLRENLRVRLDHMEHEVHHSIQPTASGEKNGKTIIVMAPSSNNAENIVFENARSHNQENVNSVNHKPGQIAKKKKTAVKKKKKKKKRPVKRRKRSQTIQLQIPKSTARVLLAYRENL